MYSIVFTDGKVIKIDADAVEWFENSKTIRFIKGKRIIARFNMENVAGWAEAGSINDILQIIDKHKENRG